MYPNGEEAEVNTIKEQGLSAPRKTWKVGRDVVLSAWAFHWGSLVQMEVTICQPSNVWVFVKYNLLFILRSLPAVTRTLPWAEPSQPADPGSTKFHLYPSDNYGCRD